VQRLLEWEDDPRGVLSVYLNLAVDATNRRHADLDLAHWRRIFEEEPAHQGRREPLLAALDAVDAWLREEYDEANHGAALFVPLAAPERLLALQFPPEIRARWWLHRRPVVRPLLELLDEVRHTLVVEIDRERMRAFGVVFDCVLYETAVEGEPYPVVHDVHAGGYSQARYQRRKDEEAHHFWKEFVEEIERLVQRHRVDAWVLLATEENQAEFLPYVPEALRAKLTLTGPIEAYAPPHEVWARVRTALAAHWKEETMDLVRTYQDRLAHRYRVAAGDAEVLAAVLEGRAETVLVAREVERGARRCPRCGYVFPVDVERCTFDDAATEREPDLVDVLAHFGYGKPTWRLRFVKREWLGSAPDVGALLRF
jgi:hypothetical protein